MIAYHQVHVYQLMQEFGLHKPFREIPQALLQELQGPISVAVDKAGDRVRDKGLAGTPMRQLGGRGGERVKGGGGGGSRGEGSSDEEDESEGSVAGGSGVGAGAVGGGGGAAGPGSQAAAGTLQKRVRSRYAPLRCSPLSRGAFCSTGRGVAPCALILSQSHFPQNPGVAAGQGGGGSKRGPTAAEGTELWVRALEHGWLARTPCTRVPYDPSAAGGGS